MTGILEDEVVVVRRCPSEPCGEVNEMSVNRRRLQAWRGGLILLQDAFPALTPAQREFIKSGYCPTHMALIFGDNP